MSHVLKGVKSDEERLEVSSETFFVLDSFVFSKGVGAELFWTERLDLSAGITKGETFLSAQNEDVIQRSTNINENF